MSSIPKKILVATDFSTTADTAEKIAYQLASHLEAELDLVHVRVILEDPLMAEEQQMEIERMMSSTDEATRQAFARDRTGDRGITVRTHLIRSVSATEAIIATASDLDCDLIVMGTHGRRGIKHLLLGSVAENVIRSVDLPVLTVRPDTAFPAHGPKRILVAHDFSDHSAGRHSGCRRLGPRLRCGRHPAPRGGTGCLSRVLRHQRPLRRCHDTASRPRVRGSRRRRDGDSP